MAQGLRHIADKSATIHIVLFAQQPHIVRNSDYALQQRCRFGIAPLQFIAIRQPTRAGQEGALILVVGFPRPSSHQPAFHEIALHSRDRSRDSRIVRWQEANQREQQ